MKRIISATVAAFALGTVGLAVPASAAEYRGMEAHIAPVAHCNPNGSTSYRVVVTNERRATRNVSMTVNGHNRFTQLTAQVPGKSRTSLWFRVNSARTQVTVKFRGAVILDAVKRPALCD